MDALNRSSPTCVTLDEWLNDTENEGSERAEIFYRNMVNFTQIRDIKYSIPVYGYLTPCLLVITFFTNAFMVAVLSRPHMRSPTNVILCAMAISDCGTLGIPVPMFIYQYTLGYHSHPVPCYLAMLDLVTTDILPTMCHSASIWLTLMLAVQRYLYVCHPSRARTLCTVPRVTFGIAVIYTIAISYNLPRFFEGVSITIDYPWNCEIHNQCVRIDAYWADWYLPVYYWFRVTCVNVIPCLLLVVLNVFLVVSLNKAQANRKRLFSERKQESSKQRDSNNTTMMLIAVVFVFLAVELPLAGITLVFIIQNTWKLSIIHPRELAVIITFSNLCIALSYSIYFPIYCSMSRQFRDTFKSLFLKAKQFTQETARNGRASKRLRNLHGNNGEPTVFVSTAATSDDDSVRTRVAVAQVSTMSMGDEMDRENETLL
ncbi:hypothetical protein RvY_01032 [Ramazzottius varieornatus]|uniref:G-protein coupled receptors family 1 profile domain-containing protein n=1 Tax=Ramazzottius varieornatus TaxID=947166 RepID=A0A1D1UF92_RAMVA|nr:hypothetical protein RvY_01032 [Ramazzottius varieornatus]